MSTRIVAMLVAAVLAAGPALADTAKCQKLVASQLAKLAKGTAKAYEKCLDADNLGKIPGPCPDAATQLKVQTLTAKVATKLGTVCTLSDLAAIGLRTTDCAYEAESTGAEGQCAAMSVSTATDAAACLACWQQAEVAELLGVLYATHAQAFCGGVDASATRCSDLGCTTPLPNQGDTNAYDCQKAIGKAGTKHLAVVTKIFQKCALAGGTESSCESDLLLQTLVQKAETKLNSVIVAKCGNNRNPEPDPPFCCKTTGNACVLAADRTDCTTNLGGQVQDGKTCGGGSCQPVPGQVLTWWGSCPSSATCPGTSLDNTGDLVECVQGVAEDMVDELLCLQFPNQGWSCTAGSPSGAFVE
jgi:hypothetical protein